MQIKISEAMIQKACMDWLRHLQKTENLVFFRANSWSFRTEQGRYVRTGTPGLSDICAIYKGVFYAFELKTATGRMSQSQKAFQAKLEAAGGRYVLCRSVGDLKEALAI
jgi:penicillin-binding protein-related factor A (putative recombinase)